MKRLFLAPLILVLAVAAAWAQAPSFPGPASPTQARLYFYRSVGNIQFSGWTSVWLDDAKVGDLGPGTYFYRDIQPGTYKVGVNSDVPYPSQYQNLTVTPNSTIFIEVFNVPGYGVTYTMGPPPSVKFPNVYGNRVMNPAAARQQMTGLSPAGG